MDPHGWQSPAYFAIIVEHNFQRVDQSGNTMYKALLLLTHIEPAKFEVY